MTSYQTLFTDRAKAIDAIARPAALRDIGRVTLKQINASRSIDTDNITVHSLLATGCCPLGQRTYTR